jgi:hypothetical protein
MKDFPIEHEKLLVPWDTEPARYASFQGFERIVGPELDKNFVSVPTNPYTFPHLVDEASPVLFPIVTASFEGPQCVQVMHLARNLLRLQNP